MYNKKWLPSPFFESRNNYPLDMIIIHHIGSSNNKLYSVKGALIWFTDLEVHRNKETGKIENKVSAHYVIPRSQHEGNDYYYLVKNENIAYHAGESYWTINGVTRKFINRYSIGIELEGDGNLVEYTNFQYDVLIFILKDLIEKYNIPENNILGHEDVAPGRKVDPGRLFDWKKVRASISPVIVTIPEIPSKDNNSSKEQNNTKKEETVKEENKETFFMEDGSKTNSLITKIISNILTYIRRNPLLLGRR